MAETYIPINTPLEYDSVYFTTELQRISNAIRELESPVVILSPQAVAPERTKEGMVMNADGTNWNPGAGAGLYEFTGGAWNKL